MNYGIQMFSVRDLSKENFEKSLAEVAKVGYKAVEFAGFYDTPAEDVKAMLDKYGLEVVGTHTGMHELTADKFEETVKYHKTIGNKFIIIPWADTFSKEKTDELIDLINEIQPKLAAEGITLGYHNHAHEYKEVDGILPIRELEARTNIVFEIDTYWVFNAGFTACDELERLGDRVRVIHLKDGTKEGKGKALGEGEAPIAEVRAKAIELGLKIVVESETQQPDGISEITRCMNFLNTLE